jgi:hypothetical protein
MAVLSPNLKAYVDTSIVLQGSYAPWNSWNILEKKTDPE